MEYSDVREGSFVWKTANFLNTTNEYRKSPEFKFGRYNCCLCIPKSFYGFSLDGVKEVDLITDNCPVVAPMFSKETIYSLCYSLCLMDRHGKEFLIKYGITHREKKVIMMVLFVDYLKAHQKELLSEEGTLTFHLLWSTRKNTKLHPLLCRPLYHRGTQTTPDFKPEKDPTNLLEILSNDFKGIYESQANTDCVLNVGETQFHVHRTVLSARSTVFSAMFSHDTSESRTGEVNILDAEVTSMKDVLHYIYSGKIRGLDEDTAVPMYSLADKYALMELKIICLQFLKHNLTTGNVCDVAVLTHTHAESELEEKVVKFIEGRLDDFEKSDKWIQFSKSRPALAIKLLSLALRASKIHQTKNTIK